MVRFCLLLQKRAVLRVKSEAHVKHKLVKTCHGAILESMLRHTLNAALDPFQATLYGRLINRIVSIRQLIDINHLKDLECYGDECSMH